LKKTGGRTELGPLLEDDEGEMRTRLLRELVTTSVGQHGKVRTVALRAHWSI